MVLGWMLAKLCLGLREAGLEVPAPDALVRHADQIGLGGGILFGTAWIWSLFTSIRLVLGSGTGTKTDSPSPPPMADQGRSHHR